MNNRTRIPHGTAAILLATTLCAACASPHARHAGLPAAPAFAAQPFAASPAPAPAASSPPGAASDAVAPKAASALYSVSVHAVPVTQLLLAIGRDARLELDLHPGIEGTVTLQAENQPLTQLMTRIAEQAGLRFELAGQHLSVRPDTPFVRTYRIDYANLSRTLHGAIATSTQIATTGSQARATATQAGNTSLTQIETRGLNDFWGALEMSIVALLASPGDPMSRCSGDSTRTCRSADVILNRESGVAMVRATGRQHTQLAAFLAQVQQAALRQVLIEALIVEVTLTDAYRQGISWDRVDTPAWRARPRGINDSAAGLPTLGYLSGSQNFSIELLETFGTVKVLSSPRLSVLNNQTAMLKVVEEVVYFLVDSTTTEYDDRKQSRISASTTPQSVSVGVVMSVTPQIGAGGDITLNVRPTISGISGFKDDPNPALGEIPNRVPQIRTREIESVLRLRSGEIAVLGGLMEDRIDHDTGRIPLLGDLPVLGELFTRRDNAVRRTELLIFLRPVVVADPSLHGDYADYATRLPDAGFGAATAAPGEANFPALPLRPRLLPGSTEPAGEMP